MLGFNPGDYGTPQSKDFYSDLVASRGLPADNILVRPYQTNLDFFPAFVGGATVTTYFNLFNPQTTTVPTDPVAYHGDLSITIYPSAWVTGTTQHTAYLGEFINDVAQTQNYLFYQTRLSAAPSNEINLANIYQFQNCFFNYIRLTQSEIIAVASSTLSMEILFSGVKIQW